MHALPKMLDLPKGLRGFRGGVSVQGCHHTLWKPDLSLAVTVVIGTGMWPALQALQQMPDKQIRCRRRGVRRMVDGS